MKMVRIRVNRPSSFCLLDSSQFSVRTGFPQTPCPKSRDAQALGARHRKNKQKEPVTVTGILLPLRHPEEGEGVADNPLCSCVDRQLLSSVYLR